MGAHRPLSDGGSVSVSVIVLDPCVRLLRPRGAGLKIIVNLDRMLSP